MSQASSSMYRLSASPADLTGKPTVFAGYGSAAYINPNTNETYVVGNNQYGQLLAPPTLGSRLDFSKASSDPTIKKLAMFGNHTIIIREKLKSQVWGLNTHGQLALPKNQNTLTPVLGVDLDDIWEDAAVGITHTLLLKAGDLYVCGDGTKGQFGSALNKIVTTPTKVSFPSALKIVEVKAGAYFSAVILSDRSLWITGMFGLLRKSNWTKIADSCLLLSTGHSHLSWLFASGSDNNIGFYGNNHYNQCFPDMEGSVKGKSMYPDAMYWSGSTLKSVSKLACGWFSTSMVSAETTSVKRHLGLNYQKCLSNSLPDFSKVSRSFSQDATGLNQIAVGHCISIETSNSGKTVTLRGNLRFSPLSGSVGQTGSLKTIAL